MDEKSNLKIWLFGQFTMEIGDFRQKLKGPKHDFLVTESKNVRKWTHLGQSWSVLAAGYPNMFLDPVSRFWKFSKNGFPKSRFLRFFPTKKKYFGKDFFCQKKGWAKEIQKKKFPPPKIFLKIYFSSIINIK